MSLNNADQTKIIKLLTALGIDEQTITITNEGDTTSVVVDMDQDKAGIYIGRFATTIDSLQLILSLLISTKDAYSPVSLDIGGYRKRRLLSLKEIVDRVATRVLESGLAHALPPLSSVDRRQVHLMLQDHDKLTTYSEGVGRDRRLYIAPQTT